MTKSPLLQSLVFLFLVVLAAGTRLVHIAPNFTAVAAVALFAGWFFPSRLLAVAAPIAAMAASDTVLGGYTWKLMVVVYASLAIPVLMGRTLGTRPGPGRIALTSLAASVLFFLTTNTAVWAFSADGIYAKTAAGLWDCFMLALPFFRYTLAGDLSFAALIFGGYYLFTRRMSVPRAQPVAG